MDPKTTEITIAAEGVVTIPTGEYSSLIACRAMLDMILASAKGSTYGSADGAVVKYAGELRKLMGDATVLNAPEDATEGEEDA